MLARTAPLSNNCPGRIPSNYELQESAFQADGRADLAGKGPVRWFWLVESINTLGKRGNQI